MKFNNDQKESLKSSVRSVLNRLTMMESCPTRGLSVEDFYLSLYPEPVRESIITIRQYDFPHLMVESSSSSIGMHLNLPNFEHPVKTKFVVNFSRAVPGVHSFKGFLAVTPDNCPNWQEMHEWGVEQYRLKQQAAHARKHLAVAIEKINTGGQLLRCLPVLKSLLPTRRQELLRENAQKKSSLPREWDIVWEHTDLRDAAQTLVGAMLLPLDNNLNEYIRIH